MFRAFLTAAFVAVAGASSAAEFLSLNDDPARFTGAAYFLSDDGRVVVGSDKDHRRTFVWTAEQGMEVLALPPGYDVTTGGRSGPIALSDDGSTFYVTASRFVAGEGYLESRRFTWTREQGYQPFALPLENFAVRAVREDEQLIVGHTYEEVEEYPFGTTREAVVWNQATGELSRLGTFDLDHLRGTTSSAVSPNGKVVVGVTGLESGLGWEYYYVPSLLSIDGEPFQEFPSPLGSHVVRPRMVNDDASLIIGYAGFTTPNNETYYEPYAWNRDVGYIRLGAQTRRNSTSGEEGFGVRIVDSASADGSVIVGYQGCTACIGDSWREAFLWDEWHGFRSLREVLINEYGMADQLADWNLESVEAISPDGTILIGEGRLKGRSQPWRVVLDELKPTALLPGDADLDGAVTLADFAAFRDHLGGGGFWYQGDFDGDGIVGLGDQRILRDAFGSTSAAVPEPAGSLLFLIGVVSWAAFRPRRRAG